MKKNNSNNNEYWKSNLKFVSILLTVWFTVSFGFGILLVENLNQFQIGGFPLGFWFSQQGSIYIFVILIFSSGSSTLPDKKMFPSLTSDCIDKKYLLSNKANLALKFFCIIVSSICIPIVLGSNVISTPAPNRPIDEQEFKIKIINESDTFIDDYLNIVFINEVNSKTLIRFDKENFFKLICFILP